MKAISRRDFLKTGGALALLASLPEGFSAYLEGSGGDDTVALQAAFDTLNDQYGFTGQEAFLILKGTFHLSDNVYLNDKYRVRIFGLDCHLVGGGLICSGSTYLTIERVHITAPVAFIHQRSDGTGGALSLSDCQFDGDAIIQQADTSTFDRVVIHGETTLSCFATTHILNSWRDCWLWGTVRLQGLLQNLSFSSCFFSNTDTCVIVENDVYCLSFENCYAENCNMFLHHAGNILSSLHIDNLNFGGGESMDYIMQIDGKLLQAHIENVLRFDSNTKLMHVFGTVKNSKLRCSSVDIHPEENSVITNNWIDCTGTQPFYGSLGTRDKNKIYSGYYNTLT